MEGLMTIGEFATAARLSQKALRLYGESGLLAPAWVDPDSGYRYYSVDQLAPARLVALLRRAGMPLAEIRAFLRDRTVDRLDDYERRVADDFAERRRVLRYVKRILKEEDVYDVLTKQVDARSYVSRSQRVLVSELDAYILETFEALGPPDEDRPFVVYHGPVNDDEDGPVEVCVPKTAGDKLLPAGEVAFTELAGAQCDFPEILGAYEAVYRWAKEHGREPAGPPREIHVDPSPETMRLEIALPLR
jgi:DNA-binding transcriptional MerR regulator